MGSPASGPPLLGPIGSEGLRQQLASSPEDLLAALGAGLVLLEQVLADGLGVNNLTLTLRQSFSECIQGILDCTLAASVLGRSLSSETLQIALRGGTIFQQKTWNHRRARGRSCRSQAAKPTSGFRQNLVTGVDYVLEVPPGGCVTKEVPLPLDEVPISPLLAIDIERLSCG